MKKTFKISNQGMEEDCMEIHKMKIHHLETKNKRNPTYFQFFLLFNMLIKIPTTTEYLLLILPFKPWELLGLIFPPQSVHHRSITFRLCEAHAINLLIKE